LQREAPEKNVGSIQFFSFNREEALAKLTWGLADSNAKRAAGWKLADLAYLGSRSVDRQDHMKADAIR
jgi:hypothetical protein